MADDAAAAAPEAVDQQQQPAVAPGTETVAEGTRLETVSAETPERKEVWRAITPEQFIALKFSVAGLKQVKTATGWALVKEEDGELVAFWSVDMKMMKNTVAVRVE